MASIHRNPFTIAVIIILAIVVVIASLITANVNFSLRISGGNDFLFHWAGFRSLILEGTSPYNNEDNEIIQTYLDTSGDQIDFQQTRSLYPLYAILIYLPFALIKDFVVARALWMTILELNIFLLAFLSLKLSGWKPSIILLVFYYLFSILFLYSAIPVLNGNASIIVAVFLTGGLLAMKNKADELAGVLFAFSTIKPQIVILFLLFVLIWSLKQKRKKIAIWFFFTCLLLLLSSMLIIPNWIYQQLLEILRFLQSNQIMNFQTMLGSFLPGFGARIGWAVSAVLIIMLMMEWRASYRRRFQGFLFTGLVTLLATQWIGIPAEIGNFIVLFPALTLTFEAWSRKWKNAGGLYIAICLISLLVIIYLLFLQTIGHGFQTQQNPALYMLLPVYLYASLTWSRWWILQPANDLDIGNNQDEDTQFFD